ncbi:MAG TPA: hypothetical protein VFO25_03290 [Candidatus Eremiobacteraceae bacterium]|nr:hypothetical protein [Candidatus Eremiobacteraceae bacterium]
MGGFEAFRGVERYDVCGDRRRPLDRFCVELIAQARGQRNRRGLLREAQSGGAPIAPLVAIPLKARGDLFGIALYGGHTDGALLNDDECAMLDHLAQNAAAAYDHIEATRTRKEIERLQSDFAQLQAQLQPE